MTRRTPNRRKGEALDPRLLLRAYAMGIFPMAESAAEEEVFWVEPEYRGVLPLDGLHISKSLGKTLRQGVFKVTSDQAFDAVLHHCAEPADDRPSTWINASITGGYKALHRLGHCHSVEAWADGKLAGGLYGVSLGRAFFGESMFSRRRDASKICLIHLVRHLRHQGFMLLDTQFTTPHLIRMGAVEIARDEYLEELATALDNGSAEFGEIS